MYPRVGLTNEPFFPGYGYTEYAPTPGYSPIPTQVHASNPMPTPAGLPVGSYGSQGLPGGGAGAMMNYPGLAGPPVSSYGSQGVPSGGAGASAPFVPKGFPPVSSYGSQGGPGGGASAAAAAAASAPGPGLQSFGSKGSPQGPGFSPVWPSLPQPVYGPYGWGNPFFQDCTPEVAIGACGASTGCSSCGTSIGAMSQTGTLLQTGIEQAQSQNQLSSEDGQGIYKSAKATDGGKRAWYVDVGIAALVGGVGGYLLARAM
jgi:hypothetical protein